MDEEITLNLKDFFHILEKRFKLILCITIGCAIAAGLASFFVIKPTYEAGSTIIVGKPKSSDIRTDNSDVMMYQNLVKTYAQIAQSNSVAKETLNRLNDNLTVEQLQKMVTVTPEQGTQILTIRAESRDPQQAVNIVNAMSNSFVDESKRVYPTGGDIQIMDMPQFPNKPVKPKKALNIAIAFFLGLLVSVGLAFLLEYSDSTIKTEEDVERYLDLPVIGIIPKMQDN
ncbi:MAG: Wzz/FepE/Etk N-terminal domain-containing protein [Clostridium sp.]|jgi:capsular polysaccharide biosynthesis protein|uniref:YveK family protein n=1 Tax=Clostridium sp. TaxID=1506 RepID=UPI0025B7AB12|nr:Wzz/FepE/Etk N-terminal domain-containing protein [Clostridium sp.]MCH3965051.1 Wzz/FepE/Etk N-terminal domain-containing protein [Clostridium sp.]MCI1714272.1 Wzz/FepE/Etk N-terminal domain-containing protein [Clostridium sp.]MCI1798534.1 Wzz/FepE/Etk N-terminal domain-containing protein [Clostridium sp.]MCI1812735.1 Wzz/FepE/Etk N-terminal domain-containing protein [Clostridium sp.]MCI1869343.1 Wzz/FepE/Etk N-terminal domain-containing protein [Clostridium sp.]